MSSDADAARSAVTATASDKAAPALTRDCDLTTKFLLIPPTPCRPVRAKREQDASVYASVCVSNREGRHVRLAGQKCEGNHDVDATYRANMPLVAGIYSDSLGPPPLTRPCDRERH